MASPRFPDDDEVTFKEPWHPTSPHPLDDDPHANYYKSYMPKMAMIPTMLRGASRRGQQPKKSSPPSPSTSPGSDNSTQDSAFDYEGEVARQHLACMVAKARSRLRKAHNIHVMVLNAYKEVERAHSDLTKVMASLQGPETSPINNNAMKKKSQGKDSEGGRHVQRSVGKAEGITPYSP